MIHGVKRVKKKYQRIKEEITNKQSNELQKVFKVK